MNESHIETKVTEYARSLGVLSLKINVRGQVGWPDRMYIWKGQVWFVEFKAPHEKPRAIQEYIHGELRKRGIRVFVVDNITEGRRIINELRSS